MAAVTLPPDSPPPQTSGVAILAKWLGIAALIMPAAAFAGVRAAGHGCDGLPALLLLLSPLLVLVAVVVASAARSSIARNPRLSGQKQARIGSASAVGGLVLFLVSGLMWPPCGHRPPGNESSAVGAVRTINTAEVTYASTYPEVGFSPTLEALGGAPPCHASAKIACLIDEVLASGRRSGYVFTYIPGAKDAKGVITRYTAVARPVEFGKTGERSFFTDESGVIRFTAEDRAPTVQDPPLQ